MSLRQHRGWGTPQTPRDSHAGDPAPNFLTQSHQGGRVSREWMPALGKGEDRRAQGDLGRDRADTLLPQPKLEASSGPGAPWLCPPTCPAQHRGAEASGRWLLARREHSPEVRSPRSCSWRARRGRRCPGLGPWRSGRPGGRQRGSECISPAVGGGERGVETPRAAAQRRSDEGNRGPQGRENGGRAGVERPTSTRVRSSDVPRARGETACAPCGEGRRLDLTGGKGCGHDRLARSLPAAASP